MTLSARCPSAIAATASGACAAEMLRMSRSCRAGRASSDGTHFTPSIRSLPGLTTVMSSAGKPSASRLRRIMRPGFTPFSDTPITAAVRGWSRRPIRAMGRGAGRAGRGPALSLSSASSATKPPAGEHQRVDLELGDGVGHERRRQLEEALDHVRQRRQRHPRRPAAARLGHQPHHGDPRQRALDRAAVGQRGGEQGQGAVVADAPRQELGVDAARAQRDDRAEVGGPAHAQQQLVSRPRLVRDELGQQVAVHRLAGEAPLHLRHGGADGRRRVLDHRDAAAPRSCAGSPGRPP